MENSYYDSINMDLVNGSIGKQIIAIQYTDIKEKVHSQVDMVDFNTFVNGIGGELGLFLGFSIIDSFLFLFKKLPGLRK